MRKQYAIINFGYGMEYRIPMEHIVLLSQMEKVEQVGYTEAYKVQAEQPALQMQIVSDVVFTPEAEESANKKEAEKYEGWYKSEREKVAKLKRELANLKNENNDEEDF